MTNITINERNNTLVITKKFEKAASKFGSPEYKELKEARADFPNFKVVVRTVKQSKDTFKGLTYSYMEKYIASHDEDGLIMEEFEIMRGTTEDSLGANRSYGEIKKWFLEVYPEFVEFQQNRDVAIAKVKANRAS